jgi:UDP-2,3-diacylglucosamine hydrolase
VTRLATYSPGAAPLELDAQRVALFTDLHLDAARADEIDAFRASLDALPGDTEVCVVMGDLFDAYVGGEDWGGAFAPLAAAFSALQARGIRVLLLRGNRDALLETRDLRDGPEVVDGVVVGAPGERVLVVHGDEFCLGDRRYQFLRRRLRGRVLRPFLRGLPLRARRALARRMRRLSNAEVARKPLDTLALTPDEAAGAATRVAADAVVVGHLHVDERRKLADGRPLRILPAWQPGTKPYWAASVLDE